MNPSEAFGLLCIPPGAAADEIRAAYLALLPAHHPEDDPEGFLRLRSAYEAALAAETQKSQPGMPQEDAEGDPFTEKLRAMLVDFPRRMDEAAWRAVLAPEADAGLDRQEAASGKLLALLMDGCFIPRRIWRLFDEYFSWSARETRLKEAFPHAFIDYVLNGIRYERTIRDDFFDFEADAGEDFDAFITAYHLLADALWSGELEKAAELEASYTSRLTRHPDYQLLLARRYFLQGDHEKAYAILFALEGEHPGDAPILSALGRVLLEDGRPEEALAVNLRALAANPLHRGARLGTCLARFETGAYEAAKAEAYELLMENPYDTDALSVFRASNNALVSEFCERLAREPKDIEARYKLVSCYFNLGSYEEALALIANETPDEAHRAKHYEFYVDLFFLTNKELDEADKLVLREYLEAWEQAETDRERLRYLPDKYYRLGFSDDAFDKAEIFLREFPAEPELCRVKALVFSAHGDLRGAFAAISEGLAKNPVHAGLLAIEASLHEASGNFEAAVESAEAALRSFPYGIELWGMLARIFSGAGRHETVLEIVDRAATFELSSPELSLLKAVALLETEDSENEAAELLEAVLEQEPENKTALENLGIHYARTGHTSCAAALLERYVRLCETPYAYLLRGWLNASCPQASDAFSKARARADFRKAIELDAHYAPAWYQLGIAAFEEDSMAEAAALFREALSCDPMFVDVHRSLAIALERVGDSVGALEALDEGISLAAEDAEGKAYGDLLLRKADLLFKMHRFAELVSLGEVPAQQETEEAARRTRIALLAYAFFQIGQDAEAERYFREVFGEPAGAGTRAGSEKTSAEWVRPNTLYGRFLLFAKQDSEAALPYFIAAYGGSERPPDIVELARALQAAGKHEEAKKLYKASLKATASVRTSCGCFWKGACLYGMGRYRRAKVSLLKAVQGASDNLGCAQRVCHEALFTLAMIALYEGDHELARKYYQRTIEAAPDRSYTASAALFE